TENENAWIETTELPQIEPDFAPDEASDDASIADSTAIDRASSPGQSSSLFTLNQDLEVIGEIRGIAPNERVYSCRFMEDIAYFVTFRQVDPLFSADLSDPAAPKLIGALKIPGFSEYLHPYAPGLLFGLGRDADEDTGVAGDIKLSMFDISNPADAKEKYKMILQGLRASEAESNHKAIVVNAGKRLIAFPSDRCYIVCGYDVETGFSRRATISLYEDNAAYFNGYYYGGEGLRGLFIGNVFYAISPNSVNAYDMDNDFAKLGTASVGDGAMPVNRYAYYLPREYPGNPGDGAEIIPFKGGIEDSIE
ncbi:MAG: beta-propeller domain-containing protein, partial [Clostridiales Family XIII bacterium]|nr:beta-propeller domain-containing protein [Clostridiales Family XIII bacterium]